MGHLSEDLTTLFFRVGALRFGVKRFRALLFGSIPIVSMYGIFTYIYHKNQPNVGKYTIHGWYGIGKNGRGVVFSKMQPAEYVVFVREKLVGFR